MGYLSVINTLPFTCFGHFWQFLPFTQGLWSFFSCRFSICVSLRNSFNPTTADISRYPLPTSNITLHLRYTLFVSINTSFLLERHFCYFSSFCPQIFTYLFYVICNTRVTFHHATKHVSGSVRGMRQYVSRYTEYIYNALSQNLLNIWILVLISNFS